MSDIFWLTDEQMAKLAPFFPKSHGKPRVDDRRVLSGIMQNADAIPNSGPPANWITSWCAWTIRRICLCGDVLN